MNGDQPTAFSETAGLVEHPRVDPTGDRTCAAEPQRVVSVVAKLRMVRAEAGIDECVFHRLRVKHGHLACTSFEWENLGVRIVGALFAPSRIIHAAHGGREPDTALLVEHGIVIVGTRVPQRFALPSTANPPEV